MPKHVFVALALACSSCLATHAAYEHLVAAPEPPPPHMPIGPGPEPSASPSPDPPQRPAQGSRSFAEKAAFFVLLPALITVDVVTLPFQYVYIVTHAY